MAFNYKSKKNSRVRQNQAISDINITPFVDVLLVLLIIFMVAAPMMTSSISLDLPQGVATPEADKNKAITISLNQESKLFINEDPVKFEDLVSKITIMSDGNLGNKINIRADKSLDYGEVMNLVKTINIAGFSQVILVTELVQE
jgi:biopolymer transport protein TolR